MKTASATIALLLTLIVTTNASAQFGRSTYTGGTIYEAAPTVATPPVQVTPAPRVPQPAVAPLFGNWRTTNNTTALQLGPRGYIVNTAQGMRSTGVWKCSYRGANFQLTLRSSTGQRVLRCRWIVPGRAFQAIRPNGSVVIFKRR